MAIICFLAGGHCTIVTLLVLLLYEALGVVDVEEGIEPFGDCWAVGFAEVVAGFAEDKDILPKEAVFLLRFFFPFEDSRLLILLLLLFFSSVP
jgi:hypothetical protein